MSFAQHEVRPRHINLLLLFSIERRHVSKRYDWLGAGRAEELEEQRETGEVDVRVANSHKPRRVLFFGPIRVTNYK